MKKGFAIQGSDDRVVLLFWGLSKERRLRNVVRLNQAGLVQWRADLPGSADHDCFVSLARHGEAFIARTYAGHAATFDADGRLIDTIAA